MKQTYDKNAYKQAYVIANFLIEHMGIVMPQNLLDVLENRMHNSYYFDINDINTVQLLPDTEKILTKIYLECLVKEKEKEKIYKLTRELKVIIEDKQLTTESKKDNALLAIDTADFSFWEKIKIKFNRLITQS